MILIQVLLGDQVSTMEKIYTDLIDEVDEALRIRKLPPSSTGNASEATSQLYWIGVCGAPASGKSTLTQEVARRLNDKGISTVVIPMDGYHFYKHELDSMPDAHEMHARRGAPWTFNAVKFVQDLTNARRTSTGSFPSFDHHYGDPLEDQIQLTPAQEVVIVEGNYLSLSSSPWCELKGLFDARWVLTCPTEVARERVIGRHLSTGDTLDEATRRADENDVPNGIMVEKEMSSTGWATRVIQSITDKLDA